MGQQQTKELPVEIGERYYCLDRKTLWDVCSGKNKADGHAVTVFVFHFSSHSEAEIQLARSAHLRLKTLRHPNVLKYIDGIELPDCIYMVTEEAVPLETHLQIDDGRSEYSISWGLHQLIKSISFLSDSCNLVHHNLHLSSVFVDAAGEWKIAGVEFMHPVSDPSPPHRPPDLDCLARYAPPESNKPGAARRAEKWSTDMWGLGCVIWEVFNGPLPQPSALRDTSKIPRSLVSHYCELVSANPRSRPSPSDLLTSLRQHGGFLSNPFVAFSLRLEELQILEPSQRNELFTELNSSLDMFPAPYSRHKILPQLLNAFEYGGAGSAVLAPLFRLGQLLEAGEYQQKIVPCVVKLFSSNDRATRLNLLQQLDQFINHLQPATINDQIFPHIATGFSDTVPALREQTVKSMLLVAPKLKDATLNTQLLKHFAKCQLDEQPVIRTNTTVCLGKIAQYLNEKTRQKVLISAFSRALKDPFSPSRSAGISGLAATSKYYSPTDIANRILPSLCPMALDPEKSVREQVFHVMRLFLEQLEQNSQKMVVSETSQQSADAAGTAASWAGWAVTSLTSKLYKPSATGSTSDLPDGTTAATAGPRENQQPAPANRPQPDDNRATRHTTQQQQPQAEVEQTDSTALGAWDDEEWEDFDTPATTTSENKASDGWGGGGWDDGWEDFSQQKPAAISKPTTVTASSNKPATSKPVTASLSKPASTSQSKAMKLKSTRTPSPALFEDDPWGSSVSDAGRKAAVKKTTPPPVSSGLFDVQEGGGGGWGDWGAEDDILPAASSKSTNTHKTQSTGDEGKEVPFFTMADSTSGGDGGWDIDDWSSPSKPSVTASATGSSTSSRQEMMQKRREERRLKQQAAREKRSAGISLAPSSGLGVTKKNF